MKYPTINPAPSASIAASIRDRRGFTLIEIMIAVVIIGVGFTALLGLHARSISRTVFNQNLDLATLEARNLITELQVRADTQGLASLSSSAGKSDIPGFRYEVEI